MRNGKDTLLMCRLQSPIKVAPSRPLPTHAPDEEVPLKRARVFSNQHQTASQDHHGKSQSTLISEAHLHAADEEVALRCARALKEHLHHVALPQLACRTTNKHGGIVDSCNGRVGTSQSG